MAELPLIENDHDLIAVLCEASNEMWDPLVGYITDGGKGRVASKLDELAIYSRHKPRHRLYVDEIASEIQTFGANSIISVFRGGKGAPYAEIVLDVADKLKVNYSKASAVADIEQQILLKVLDAQPRDHGV